MIPRLKEKYIKEVRPQLMKNLNFKNIMQVPRLDQIVVNMGVGQATQNPKILEEAKIEITQITGQAPKVTKAKKAISNFKLKAGAAIGCKVSLHGNYMYEFFDRLINVAMPRIRDFRGCSKGAFDGNGNYNLGIKEQIIFLEIDLDKVEKVKGMNITFCTSARNDQEALALLEAMGMPFRKK